MGNTSSLNKNNSETEFQNFYDIIDYIATYYILTMDFKSLSKLSEKAYCDKLVVLSSDIIERYFNDMEITYLAQRIKNGVEVNDLKKEKVIFINKDNLDTFDISNDTQKNIRKKRVCIGIAKFYVKIAHIFAAIVMTINPVYTYKDATGQIVKTGLLEKDKIPKNIDRKLFKYNICDNRIRALKKGQHIDEKTGNVILQPQVCDMNTNQFGQMSLADEPGITELITLYFDDNYDYSNGLFTGMSQTTKKQFNKDLKEFYTAFTGNDIMPPEITKFNDIKLRNYNKKTGCQTSNPIFKNKYFLNKKDKLFINYAENIKKMIQRAADNQSKLLNVINELFTYVIDPYSNKKVIKVNPKLNEELLQKAVEKTRRMIIDLYVGCETDYVNGIKIYEAIVESKILETTQNQIESLKKEASTIIKETKQIFTPIQSDDTNTSPNLSHTIDDKTKLSPNNETNSPLNIDNTNTTIDNTNTNIDNTNTTIDNTNTNIDNTNIDNTHIDNTNINNTNTNIDNTNTNIDNTNIDNIDDETIDDETIDGKRYDNKPLNKPIIDNSNINSSLNKSSLNLKLLKLNPSLKTNPPFSNIPSNISVLNSPSNSPSNSLSLKSQFNTPLNTIKKNDK